MTGAGASEKFAAPLEIVRSAPELDVHEKARLPHQEPGDLMMLPHITQGGIL